jgi:hypothetical protein
MARYGIGKALVYHSLAREYNPQVGNDEVLKETGKEPALFPAWVVLPHHTGEFPEPKKLVSVMKAANVRAVRVFPGAMELLCALLRAGRASDSALRRPRPGGLARCP